MKNFELDENDPIKILIRESGVESPKEGFHLNILNNLSSLSVSKPYEPVISYFAMKIIGGVLACLFISVLLFVPSSESNISFWNQLPSFSLPRLSFTIPHLALPKIQLGPIFNFSIVVFSMIAFSLTLVASRKWRYQ